MGVPRTFEGQAKDNIEAHLLGFEGDLYGRPLVLDFVEWLRPQRAIASTEELVATISGNNEWERDNL